MRDFQGLLLWLQQTSRPKQLGGDVADAQGVPVDDSDVDPASLGLATVAAVWALFGQPGDWSITSLVIGLTISFLLLGYHRGRGAKPTCPQEWARREAFAALLALAACLIAAWPLQGM